MYQLSSWLKLDWSFLTARAPARYVEALEELSPNIHILAIIATEANFNVCSWANLDSALSKAIEIRLVDEEQWQVSKNEFNAFAAHQIAKSPLGLDFERQNADSRQLLIKHFFENDFKYTLLQVMNMLSDTGLVDPSPEWEGHEIPEWKEFEVMGFLDGTCSRQGSL